MLPRSLLILELPSPNASIKFARTRIDICRSTNDAENDDDDDDDDDDDVIIIIINCPTGSQTYTLPPTTIH